MLTPAWGDRLRLGVMICYEDIISAFTRDIADSDATEYRSCPIVAERSQKSD